MTDNQERGSVIFARKVRELRTGHGWSQAELGRRVGLGQSRMAAIEDTGSVTIDQALDFADALGVPVEVLLYEQPPAGDVKVLQLQRLLQIANAADRLKDDVNRLVEQIGADQPGKLPPGTAVTAAEMISLPPLPESE
jgi:transcriptional regulator with XRE-family HTH domain